jgi:uncharacterized protein (DUF58 family)
VTAPLLDAETVRQLERLRLRSLTAVIAGLSGERQGTPRAARVEFSDHRPYTPGDELRRVDWNVYARLRQLIVKVGPQEGRLSLALLVDTSRSMRFGEPSKWRHAQRLAACIGAVALLRGDAAQVFAAGDGRVQALARLDGPRQMLGLAAELETLPEAVATGLAECLRDLRRSSGDPDLAVLISDMSVPADETDAAISLLAGSARAASLIHVVAPQERDTVLRGPVELRDAESGRTVSATLTDQAAAAYRDRFADFAAGIELRCRREGVGYVRADTDVEPLDALIGHAGDASLSYA